MSTQHRCHRCKEVLYFDLIEVCWCHRNTRKRHCEDEVEFHAEIVRLTQCERWQYTGEYMAAIQAGNTGIFQLVVTASDDSNVVLSGVSFSANDPNVTIAVDGSDASGATVDVTVPASDTLTTFTLSATANATSNTQPNAAVVSASLDVTISPASIPVTFKAQIVQK